MSSPTPDGERPPEPTTQPAAPPTQPVFEPDAETARVPVPQDPMPDPTVEPPGPAPLTVTPSAPPTGIISATPVGWTDPAQPAIGDSPASGWAVPAPKVPVAVTAGVVVAGVFVRLVAYSVDVLLLGSINIVVGTMAGAYLGNRTDTLSIAVSGLFIGFDFLYFVGLWTSGWQATLGMRLLKLRVLDEITAGTLPANEALLRWLALSGAASILMLVPGIGGVVSLIGFLWVLALLISTGTNRLHQGFHDRWARSVVVQPAPGGSGAAIVTCLILIVLVAVVLPIAFLVVAGDQIDSILSQVGRSV